MYAAFGEYADHEIGRLFDDVRETGQFDNTLIFYVLGDNGTSAEGGMSGMFSEHDLFQWRPGNRAGHAQSVSTTWGGPTT